MAPSEKKRAFVFTYNNYDPALMLTYQAIGSQPCVRYFTFGREIAESGTPHLQGFIYFKSPRTHRGAVDFLQHQMPGCHVEMARGSNKEAIDYCHKDDADPFEEGDRPHCPAQDGARTAEFWKTTRVAAEEGRLDDIDEQIRFKNDQCIERHRYRALKKRQLADTEEQHEWYWGPSNTGKSRKARENEGAYLKMCNKWWDGYEQEDVVIIEDFDKCHSALCHHMKIWADRYPFTSEVKNHVMKIRPSKIIVTSNYHPSDIWDSAEDLEPILRRFKCTKFSTAFTGEGNELRRSPRRISPRSSASSRRKLSRQDDFSGF